MAIQIATSPASTPVLDRGSDLVRFWFLEGSSDLLLGQLRLHAKRVRALAATYRRETRRLAAGVSPELSRIDVSFDNVAQETTVALRAIDSAFVTTFTGVSAMEHYATTVDAERPHLTTEQRIAGQARDLLENLRRRHAQASSALRVVVVQLVVNANHLAIAVGQPGALSLEQFRVIIRLMRGLSQTTDELGGRLDVFVQNLSAALQELAPGESSRESVLASLRATGTGPTVPREQGAE